jgi:hypothetical protein
VWTGCSLLVLYLIFSANDPAWLPVMAAGWVLQNLLLLLSWKLGRRPRRSRVVRNVLLVAPALLLAGEDRFYHWSGEDGMQYTLLCILFIVLLYGSTLLHILRELYLLSVWKPASLYGTHSFTYAFTY